MEEAEVLGSTHCGAGVGSSDRLHVSCQGQMGEACCSDSCLEGTHVVQFANVPLRGAAEYTGLRVPQSTIARCHSLFNSTSSSSLAINCPSIRWWFIWTHRTTSRHDLLLGWQRTSRFPQLGKAWALQPTLLPGQYSDLSGLQMFDLAHITPLSRFRVVIKIGCDQLGRGPVLWKAGCR